MTAPATTKKTFTLERTLKASPEKVWKMWTTKEGIERWWGPDGFSVQVFELDVRVDGRLELVMKTAVPEIVAFLNSRGLSSSNMNRCKYTLVEPPRRLVYETWIDFVPGVPPYAATTRVELTPIPEGTRLTVTNDVMHDAWFTEGARMGWEQELGKLERALA